MLFQTQENRQRHPERRHLREREIDKDDAATHDVDIPSKRGFPRARAPRRGGAEEWRGQASTYATRPFGPRGGDAREVREIAPGSVSRKPAEIWKTRMPVSRSRNSPAVVREVRFLQQQRHACCPTRSRARANASRSAGFPAPAPRCRSPRARTRPRGSSTTGGT